MRRKRRRLEEPAHNLDSFLDTLTNTVGVMIFVLLFVTLSAADATVLVHTPLRSHSDKAPIYFDVSGDRVARLDHETGERQLRRFMRSLPSANLYNLSYLIQRIYGYSGSTENHLVDVTGSLLSGTLGTRYRLRDGAGETARAIRQSGSAFQRALAGADTAKRNVAFIVRPDAFEAFREARKVAAARGFQSGWEPLESGTDLVFSRRGREIGVQ